MNSRRIIVLGIVLLFMVAFIPLGSSAASTSFSTGPYVDKIEYKVITGDGAQVQALLNNEIDLIGDMVDPSFLPELDQAEDIEIANVLRNGYGYYSINCDKYPFNITAFRRALAFALDKEAICDEVWNGLAQPHDSPVPIVNPFSIEGQLSYNYYEAKVAKGAALLDQAGFIDVDGDGYREAPDGSDFDVLIESSSSSQIATATGEMVAEALQNLAIDAQAIGAYFYEYLTRLYFHGDYDIMYLGETFSEYNVDWLAHEYWSEHADEPYLNFPNFRNASFDSWRDQLIYSTSYEDVYEAAIEMQKILVYECPILVCYENILLSAYRTDRFTNHVNDVNEGVMSWWTNYQVRLKSQRENPYGGTFRWSLPYDIDTFNFMTSISSYAYDANQMMWDSLLRMGPDGDYIPWLAESYSIETHADNPKVPDGHTRIIFQMGDNAQWSDGHPITADDVAYSFNYYRNAPGNPLGVNIADIMSAYSRKPSEMVVEFKTESYWHLSTVALKPIVPKHIFLKEGFPEWNEWEPDPHHPEESFFVTSGPFVVSDYVAGNFTELSYNPYYRDQESHHGVPLIEGLGDLYVEEGTSGNVLTWNCSCSIPVSFRVFQNNILIQSDNLEDTEVSVNLDSLDLGVYNFTLELYTDFGHTIHDEVRVYVVRNQLLDFSLFNVSMLVTVSSLAVIVVFGSAIIKNQ